MHALVGFFNAETINEWRTPNTIALRIQGRGDRFFAFVILPKDNTSTTAVAIKDDVPAANGKDEMHVGVEVGGAVNPGSILLSSLLKQNGLPSDWIKVVSETSNASATAS